VSKPTLQWRGAWRREPAETRNQATGVNFVWRYRVKERWAQHRLGGHLWTAGSFFGKKQQPTACTDLENGMYMLMGNVRRTSQWSTFMQPFL